MSRPGSRGQYPSTGSHAYENQGADFNGSVDNGASRYRPHSHSSNTSGDQKPNNDYTSLTGPGGSRYRPESNTSGGQRPSTDNASLTGSQISYPGADYHYPGAHSRSGGPTGSSVAVSGAETQSVGLEKKVGLVSGTALIVGTMIGSGIFISPAGVAEGSGSVGLSLIVWLSCGIISVFGALSYAELGTLITKSGAEYAYLLESFGPLHKHIGPLVAFLFNWVNMVLLKPSAVSIILLAFATYVLDPFYDLCSQPAVATKCLAILAVLILMVINCVSVRAATILQNVLTVAKLLAIAIIIIGGLVKIGMGHTQHLASGFDGTETNPGKIAIAFYNGMWAYDGWNNLNYVTEEIINPFVNLPRAIYIGIPLVTLCYLLVNISYFSVMSVGQILDSPAVAVTWGNNVLGVMAWIIPVFVACSTFGAANGTMFANGRLTYVAAREGHMMELLSMIHVKRLTPLPSVVFTAIMSIIFIIPGDIASLIDFFSFAVWFFYGLTMVALLILRWTQRDVHRPYKVPLPIPIIVLLASIYLVFAPIIIDPQVEFLYAFIFILFGVLFYIPFVVYAEKTIPKIAKVLDPVTSFFQCLMEVSPATEES